MLSPKFVSYLSLALRTVNLANLFCHASRIPNPSTFRTPLRRRPQIIITLRTMPDPSPTLIFDEPPGPNRGQNRKEQCRRPIWDDDESIMHRNPARIIWR